MTIFKASDSSDDQYSITIDDCGNGRIDIAITEECVGTLLIHIAKDDVKRMRDALSAWLDKEV